MAKTLSWLDLLHFITKVAQLLMRLDASDDAALGARVLEYGKHPLKPCLVLQRPLGRALLKTVANDRLISQASKLEADGFVGALVHMKCLSAMQTLPALRKAA